MFVSSINFGTAISIDFIWKNNGFDLISCDNSIDVKSVTYKYLQEL